MSINHLFAWRKPIVGVVGLLLAVVVHAQINAQLDFDHTHASFDNLLKRYVVDGRVDYRGVAASGDDLETYLHELASVDGAAYAGWTRNQQLAFWINAYNAFAIKAIIDHYPLKRKGFTGLAFPANSIWQIPGVWKKLKRPAAGRSVALDDIEHKILRPTFREPRIHFALVCAALSCPSLRSEAYQAEHLDAQLDDQAYRFLSDPTKGFAIDADARKVRLSRIFKWFGEDFENDAAKDTFARRSSKQAGVLAFVLEHLEDERAKNILRKNRFKIRYFDYDWNLNEQA